MEKKLLCLLYGAGLLVSILMYRVDAAAGGILLAAGLVHLMIAQRK